ncbi:hypothetical protein [Flavobacterium aquicola]|uniref:Lipoprotein n=1 Tax=Flavobacterium aquicola TaxID=1682742 RepID=A0A3E0EPW4_9FLAO|nr:hypothetical protein [Flavobacterium aquicola]REG99760.1 hypothetical protein C8P67_104395 [Flavobacterium aquicola]
MMKYILGIAALLFFSCGNKEDILLPKADRTIVKEVMDLSPIYIFFRVNGKDTLAEVNRKNSISTTNWILNIDKRLPLRLVIPEVMKLQEKRRGDSAHKNEAAQNYYSYADSIGKNLAFIPFTNVHYKMVKPKAEVIVFFDKSNKIWVNGLMIKNDKFKNFINEFIDKKSENYQFCFSEDLSFGNYIQYEIYLQSLKINNGQEFIN